MSRWNNFKVEEIRQQIGDIQIRLENLNSLDPSITASMPDFPFEIARAREVLSFIDDYLKSIKPHLLRSGYSSQDIINQLNNISSSISQFQVNKNFGYITNINNSIDNILSYLSQNTFPTIQKTKATTSLSSIIQSYEQNIENSLKNLDFPNVSKQIHSIDTAYRQILVDENSLLKLIQNTKSETDKKLQEINEIQKEIENQHNLICDDSNGQESLMSQIENVTNKAMEELEEIQKFKQTSQENNNAIQSTTNELQNFYYKVFGKEESNQKGLKQELEEYEESMKAKFSEWKKEIKELLGQATNASLASSYQESRQSYEKSIRVWNGLFIACMIALFLVAITMDFQKIDLSNPYAILSLFLARIPFFIPFIWLAIFSTRRRNEIKRLQEEYRHKETIAKSYSGYKEQIEKVGDDDGKLAKQLMENLVAMTNDNPNKALDKIKQENTPSLELLEKIGELPKEIQEAITPSLLEKFLKLKK